MGARSFVTLLIAAIAVQGAALADSEATGDWSSPVDGLQGRLHIQEDPSFNGTRMLAVYLELRNSSELGSPMEIYYDNSNEDGAVCNRAGTMVAAMNGPLDVIHPKPYWLALPHDSQLRFRVSWGGFGVPNNGGAMVDMNGGPWLLKRDSNAPYFLSARFHASKHNDATVTNQWEGTLELPRVQVPLGAVSAAYRTTGP